MGERDGVSKKRKLNNRKKRTKSASEKLIS